MDINSLNLMSSDKLITLICSQLSNPETRNSFFTGMIIRQLGIKTFETIYSRNWKKTLTINNMNTNISSYVVFEGKRLMGIYCTEIEAVTCASIDTFRRIVIYVDSNGKIIPRMPWIYMDD